MTILQNDVLSHLPEAYRLMSEGSRRRDLGYCGLPMLTAILFLSIITYGGCAWSMMGHTQLVTGYTYSEAEIQDVLDQFEGDDPTYHLWRRKADGSYELLI